MMSGIGAEGCAQLLTVTHAVEYVPQMLFRFSMHERGIYSCLGKTLEYLATSGVTRVLLVMDIVPTIWQRSVLLSGLLDFEIFREKVILFYPSEVIKIVK